MKLKALLLAAGLGTRLRPLTDVLPKCLVPINGVPLLGYWLDICRGEVDGVLVNLHYKSDLVKAYLHGLNLPGVSAVHEDILLGTGGTLLKNRDFFASGPSLLVHADNLSFFDLAQFKAAHAQRPAGCPLTMVLFRTPTPQSCGIVECDSRGVVQRFHEKVASPPGNLANGAVYIVEPEIIDFMAALKKPTGFVDFSTEVLPQFLGRIHTFLNDTYHRDIGEPQSYLAAQMEYRWNLRQPLAPWWQLTAGLPESNLDTLARALAETFHMQGSCLHDRYQAPPTSPCLQIYKKVPRSFSAHDLFAKTGEHAIGLGQEFA